MTGRYIIICIIYNRSCRVMIHLEFIALDVVKTRRIIISEIANENHSLKLRNCPNVYIYINKYTQVI